MITKENLAEANTNLGYMDIERYNKKTGPCLRTSLPFYA